MMTWVAGQRQGIIWSAASELFLLYDQGNVKDDSRVLVVGAMEGYAWDAGMRTGDHIIAIDGKAVKGVELPKVGARTHRCMYRRRGTQIVTCRARACSLQRVHEYVLVCIAQ